MNTIWTICVLLGQLEDFRGPQPPAPLSHIIPESLTDLLTVRPELAAHHEGYLRALARRPDLAESETRWWQVSSGPGLRAMAARFEEALARDNTAQLRFDAYFEALAGSPGLRTAVENLVRVEMEHTRDDPALQGALQFLRANPDIALRFLDDPRLVRPLPAPLEETYETFEALPEWTRALHGAYRAIADSPDAHPTVFPWWRTLATLERGGSNGGGNFEGALYGQSHRYWLWHLRNLNLADNGEIAPWVRYWNRLIQRQPDLARDYGPFITRLMENPEQLREHLADLQGGPAVTMQGLWPPDTAPPALPPLTTDDPLERVKGTIARPEVPRPTRPEVTRPPRPQRPARPTPPGRPQLETSREGVRR